MQQILKFITWVYSYVLLNMFRASSRPLSEAQQLQSQPLVLPFERVIAVL
jgi:hypothetical protein